MILAAASDAAARLAFESTTIAAAVEDCNSTVETVDAHEAASFLVNGLTPMADLDTEIEGEVSSVRAVGRWLQQDLRSGFDGLATTVAQQRTDAAGDWQGEAGTAFAGRARELAQSGDEGATVTGQVATLVDDLAEDMQTAKDAMADVRTKAREGDLEVDGFTVRNPGDGPPSAGQSPAPDATPGEWDAWEAKDAAVRDHNRKVEVWNQCVEDATAAFDAWQRALEAGASRLAEARQGLRRPRRPAVSANIQIEPVRRATPHLTGEVDRMLQRAAELRAHADALRTPDGRVTDPSRFYELMDEADRLDDAHPSARRALGNWELPKGLTRGLWVIDLATTGYAIVSDWEEEGPAQAITSNAVPAAASILAGTASGAYIGGVVGAHPGPRRRHRGRCRRRRGRRYGGGCLHLGRDRQPLRLRRRLPRRLGRRGRRRRRGGGRHHRCHRRGSGRRL